MSVLIKNMEMPKNCHECRLYEGDIYYCSAADKMLDIPDSSAEKCRFCPLGEVPTPHGRLIDADALHYSRIRIAHNDGTIGGYNAVVMSAEIKDAPTIIEAEE